MTEWGIDTLFNPGKRHMDEEKRRLQSTREEIGDSSGGRRIDLESGVVTISRGPKQPEADQPAEDEADVADAESAGEDSAGADSAGEDAAAGDSAGGGTAEAEGADLDSKGAERPGPQG